MRDPTSMAAAALGGAVLAIVVIFAAAAGGLLPSAVSGPAVRDYLLANPGLINEMNDKYQAMQQANLEKASAAAMKKIGLAAFFDPKIAFVTGPADAKKSVVEFYDYNCPYCRVSQPAMEKFYQAHKNDTRFSFIEYPIKGPDSVVASRAALAARLQPDKFLALHFALMAETELVDEKVLMAAAQKVGIDIAKLNADMKDPSIEAAIGASHDLAKRAGIDGTPTFIVNGAIHPGAVDDAALNRLAKEG